MLYPGIEVSKVRAKLRKIEENLGAEKLYYNTRNGLVRVYAEEVVKELLYLCSIEHKLSENKKGDEKICLTIL